MIGVMSGAPACVMPARGAAAGHGAVGDPAVADAATPYPSTPSAPGRSTTTIPAADADPSRANAEPTARPAGDAAAAETAPAGAAARRHAAHNGPDRDGTAPGDFAALLAASSPIDAGIAAAAAPPASTASDTSASDSSDPAATALPEQFLALLSDSWAMPSAAAPSAAAGAPGLPTAAAQAGNLPPPAAPVATAMGASSATLPTSNGLGSLAETTADPRDATTERAGGESAPPVSTPPMPPVMVGQHQPRVPPARATPPQSGSVPPAVPSSQQAGSVPPALAPAAGRLTPDATGEIVVSPGEPAAMTRDASSGRTAIELAGPVSQAPILTSTHIQNGGLPPATHFTFAANAPGAIVERPASDPGASPADGTAALGSVALTSAAPIAETSRAGTLPPTTPLALPADPEAGFDDGFGTRITWMAEQRLGHAQIRLNPEHVGPIDVRVQLDGNRVSAEFTSAHAEVRQAIEASLPRLREMLVQHGLQLGQADVGHGQPGRRGDPMRGHGHDPAREAGLDPHPTAGPIRSARGLLDEYA